MREDPSLRLKNGCAQDDYIWKKYKYFEI